MYAFISLTLGQLVNPVMLILLCVSGHFFLIYNCLRITQWAISRFKASICMLHLCVSCMIYKLLIVMKHYLS